MISISLEILEERVHLKDIKLHFKRHWPKYALGLSGAALLARTALVHRMRGESEHEAKDTLDVADKVDTAAKIAGGAGLAGMSYRAGTAKYKRKPFYKTMWKG